jgi:hypothetical protein
MERELQKGYYSGGKEGIGPRENPDMLCFGEREGERESQIN